MLSIISTPIGNLEDMTLRAIRVLREADIIACEDTRVTGVLLKHHGISHGPMMSIHQHSADANIAKIIEALKEGERVAYASDAGTPNVNDPGGKLVEAAYAAGCEIEVIPGASALTAAMSACGFQMEHFRYVGFIPMKKHRKTTLERIASDEDATIFFESTHRIQKTLEELAGVLDENRLVYLGRELTKMHETHYRGTIREIISQLEKGSSKGEFVGIVAGK